MATGTVKWFDADKGYGFITSDERGEDRFVHQSGIVGNGYPTLADGVGVAFEREANPKGPKAVKVRAL